MPKDERTIRISHYRAMLYIGIVTGILLATRWAGLHGLSASKVNAALLILVLPALAGARLLFVATHWERFRRHPQRIWRRTDGGAALFGGLVLAVALSVPLLRAIGIAFGAFWDAAIIAMLVGINR